MTGPELARYEQGAYRGFGFPIRIDQIEWSNIENAEVFYDVMPTTQEIPYYREQYKLIHQMIEQKINAVISGNEDLDEALLELESEIEKLLHESLS